MTSTKNRFFMLTAAATTAGFVTMATPNQAQAGYDCLDAYAPIDSPHALILSIANRYINGFCDENAVSQSSFYDTEVRRMWGYCVENLGTSAERSRIQDGWRDPATIGGMYPYTDTGGSLKNRRLSARYADAILERASGGRHKFFLRTDDVINNSAGEFANLIDMRHKCGAPDNQ